MYPIGTRIIKISGSHIGHTGIVHTGPTTRGLHIRSQDAIHGWDIYVLREQPYKDIAGFDHPAGSVAIGKSRSWIPINPDTDPHFQEQPKEMETT